MSLRNSQFGSIRTFAQRRFEAERDVFVGMPADVESEALWPLIILVSVTSVIAAYFSDWVGLLWVLTYAVFAPLDQALLKRFIKTPNVKKYLSLQAIYALRLLVFRSMIVYLWYYDHPAAPFMAFILLLAATRFSASNISRASSRVVIVAVADCLVLAFLAYEFLFNLKDLADAPFAGIALIGLIGYYAATSVQALDKLQRYELLEAQTRQAQKMEAVGRLTGGVAHDFNNIMTVIIGNLDLAEEIGNTNEAKDLRNKARLAAERASDLTSKLLAFSRQSPLVMRTYEIPELVKNVIDLSSRVLPANIKIETQLDPGIWPIRTDGNQLETALLNLVINARDAMPAGGKLILEARNIFNQGQFDGLREGRYVGVSLEDEGTGIPAAILDQVTEPFFTTKSVGKGSGLGLSMVKGFAEQSGGALKIENTPKGSAKVTLILQTSDANSSSPSDDTGI